MTKSLLERQMVAEKDVIKKCVDLLVKTDNQYSGRSQLSIGSLLTKCCLAKHKR